MRIVVTGRDVHRLPEARELFEEEANRLRPRALAFVEVAADRQRVGVTLERFVDDADERVGERLAPHRSPAGLRKGRLQVHVRAVHDPERHAVYAK